MNIHDLEMLECARRLRETGMTSLSFPVKDLIDAVEKGYRKLVEESWVVRNPWSFDLSCSHNDPDDGLIVRPGALVDGQVMDEKMFFHFRPRLLSLLRKRRAGYADYAQWLLYCAELYEVCVRTQNEFAKALDTVFPGRHFYDMVRDEQAQDMHVLRLLCYSGNGSAKDHQDRSLWTIHMSQTDGHTPLHLGEEQEEYVSAPDSALMFAGKKIAQHTGASFNLRKNMFEGGMVRAITHGVSSQRVVSEITPKGPVEKRVAIVFFGHVVGSLPGKN